MSRHNGNANSITIQVLEDPVNRPPVHQKPIHSFHHHHRAAHTVYENNIGVGSTVINEKSAPGSRIYFSGARERRLPTRAGHTERHLARHRKLDGSITDLQVLRGAPNRYTFFAYKLARKYSVFSGNTSSTVKILL
ncbi:hypothetical protein CBL_08686 [Carabus blaptoides fortunei]